MATKKEIQKAGKYAAMTLRAHIGMLQLRNGPKPNTMSKPRVDRIRHRLCVLAPVGAGYELVSAMAQTLDEFLP